MVLAVLAMVDEVRLAAVAVAVSVSTMASSSSCHTTVHEIFEKHVFPAQLSPLPLPPPNLSQSSLFPQDVYGVQLIAASL
jgi:hypothetical protein